MTEPHRGEIWWSEAPDIGRRPVLVIQRTSAIVHLHSVLAAPITRRVRGIASEVLLGPDDGLPQKCAATFDNVRPIRKSHLVERICTLNAARMHEACLALTAAADC